MSRAKDTVIAGLALSTAALAVVAWWQRGEIRALAAEPAATARPAGATVRVATATNRTETVGAPQRAAAAREARQILSGGDAEAAGHLPTATEPHQRPKRGGDGLARLMENPEFVQALGRQRHAMLDVRFAALFRELGLSGDELAEFKRLLVEKENVLLDVVTVSETATGGPLAPETMRQSVRLAQAQIDQAIRTSLGPERFGIYREFERTLAQRATVAQLEQRLSYTGAPLSPRQAESMVRILAASAPAAAAESVPVISILVRDGVPEAVPVLPTAAATGRVTDEVIEQAQTVLAPVQVAALREIQDQQLAGIRAAELIRSVAPPTGGPTTLVPFLLQ